MHCKIPMKILSKAQSTKKKINQIFCNGYFSKKFLFPNFSTKVIHWRNNSFENNFLKYLRNFQVEKKNFFTLFLSISWKEGRWFGSEEKHDVINFLRRGGIDSVNGGLSPSNVMASHNSMKFQ